MKKFINNPGNLTPELLKGLVPANKDLIPLGESRVIINDKLAQADRMTIVAQDGSGHEPVINGFVGGDIMDVSVVSDVFAASGSRARLDTTKLADKGKGVLYIILNHAGDMPAGNLTMEKCAKESLSVIKMVVQEDIVNAPKPSTDDGHGLVGYIPVHEIARVAAAKDKSLEEVAAVVQRSAGNMTTLTVAILSAAHPAAGSPLANLGEDEMEISIGQHGEGDEGYQSVELTDETAVIILNGLATNLDIRGGGKVTLIPNDTGVTTLMELFTVCRKCMEYLKGKNIEIVADRVGRLLTVWEQAGFQMFMARMDDELFHC